MWWYVRGEKVMVLRCLKVLLMFFGGVFALTLMPDCVADSGGRSRSVTELRDRILSLIRDDNPEYIDALYGIDSLPIDQAISLCVELADYNLDAGVAEVYLEQCSKIGERIVPLLVGKKNSPLECSDDFKDLCAGSREERNRVIQDALFAIKYRIVLYAEYPESLGIQTQHDIKTIQIFLRDYRSTEGRLPQDLEMLRSYAWARYGYNLKILDPYGRALTYSVQDDSTYNLKAEERFR
jgi:hypothetical protein